ncbi:hypothetical protein HBA55_34615 [Pseudomaricurvus alkylphenolicus]|uniref:hypothetical protein n=1 Tax=Pseudomaricurvus alkylphenolicus TaxID=1306991 RepID=UPI001420C5C5|nr:hypothetical protein [Pseudomaricurvus alkylphenolicus]NIB44765.1 hypothetical protein [Pseudomaricurvus alkylphenolicus]
MNFTWPSSAADVVSAAQAATASGDAQLSQAGSRLSAVPGPSITKNPTATTANTASTNAASHQALFNVSVDALCVHPWQQGVGSGDGVYRHLSAPNAVAALVNKLNDQADHRLPVGTLEGVAVLINAVSLSDFAQQLGAFNAVFPVEELQAVQRRVEQLSTLENDKVLLPDAALNARWVNKNLLQWSNARSGASHVDRATSMASAYDSENQTPTAELQALIAKKQSRLQSDQSALSTLQASVTGGAGQALFLDSGTRTQLADALNAAGSPGHEYIFCAAVLMVSPPGQLAYVKEVMGL